MERLVTATPNPGYRFVGFTGLETGDATVTLNLTANTSIEAVFEVDEADFEGDSLNPEPFNLNLGPYSLLGFAPDSPMGSYPPNSRILMSANSDPNILADITLPYTSPYNLTSRTRVEASGGGIAFVNTGNPTSDGSTSGYLGALVVGLKSTGQSGLKVNFTAETLEVNTRIYGIALQYRIGTEGAFSDVLLNGDPLRYIRSTTAGQRQTYFAIALPPETANQPYLQLRWKYYYISGGSGARAKLRIDDILVYTDSFSAISGVKVNEIMASNVAWDHPAALDEFGDRSDWVELYNANAEAVNLKGCYLTDSQSQTGKWMFPAVTISGNSHLLLRASNHDIQNAASPLHTNFAISSAGEPIILSDINGTMIDFVDAFPIPADNSYGRMPDGSANWVVMANPSPGLPNLSIQAPGNVTITMQSGTLHITWGAVENAGSYKIYAADEPDASIWEELETVNAPAWQCALADLPQRKFYRITAMP